MAQQIYDYAVIGSGLTGLSIATALSRETKSIALIEAADVCGGTNRKVQLPTGTLNNGLRFLPDSVLSEKALRFLEGLIEQPVIADVKEEAPVTYEAGGLKTFLGFGDNPPDFYEELNYFMSSKRIELSVEPYEWTQKLFEKFKGDFLPRSYVTKFNVQDKRITHVTINGAKTIQAQNFIFTGTVRDLQVLLPDEVLSARAKSKLSKNSYWTALCLDLCHSQKVTDNSAMHILNGTTQDEIGPCAGRFLAAVEVDGKARQASQWVTFIDFEATEDNEVVGLALKKIKRQIKRAYPEALDELLSERIFVSPIIGGTGDLKHTAHFTLSEAENLWVASATLNGQRNLVGSLLQAEIILNSLGFVTNPIEPHSHFADQTELAP